MLTVGLFLLFASMGLGLLGLAKRGYELLVVIGMIVLLVLGFYCTIRGLIG